MTLEQENKFTESLNKLNEKYKKFGYKFKISNDYQFLSIIHDGYIGIDRYDVNIRDDDGSLKSIEENMDDITSNAVEIDNELKSKIRHLVAQNAF